MLDGLTEAVAAYEGELDFAAYAYGDGGHVASMLAMLDALAGE